MGNLSWNNNSFNNKERQMSQYSNDFHSYFCNKFAHDVRKYVEFEIMYPNWIKDPFGTIESAEQELYAENDLERRMFFSGALLYQLFVGCLLTEKPDLWKDGIKSCFYEDGKWFEVGFPLGAHMSYVYARTQLTDVLKWFRILPSKSETDQFVSSWEKIFEKMDAYLFENINRACNHLSANNECDSDSVDNLYLPLKEGVNKLFLKLKEELQKMAAERNKEALKKLIDEYNEYIKTVFMENSDECGFWDIDPSNEQEKEIRKKNWQMSKDNPERHFVLSSVFLFHVVFEITLQDEMTYKHSFSAKDFAWLYKKMGWINFHDNLWKAFSSEDPEKELEPKDVKEILKQFGLMQNAFVDSSSEFILSCIFESLQSLLKSATDEWLVTDEVKTEFYAKISFLLSRIHNVLKVGYKPNVQEENTPSEAKSPKAPRLELVDCDDIQDI